MAFCSSVSGGGLDGAGDSRLAGDCVGEIATLSAFTAKTLLIVGLDSKIVKKQPTSLPPLTIQEDDEYLPLTRWLISIRW